MDLILAAFTIFGIASILMIRDADRQMKRATKQTGPGRMMKAAKPAAREGIHISLVTDHGAGRTYRGLWIETRTGSTVIELTPRRNVAWPSVN